MDNKKKKNKRKVGAMDISIDSYLRTDNIEYESVGDNCKDAMTIFMVNNNLQRMIPDYKDGLKPVQRRILITADKLKLRFSFAKVNTIVGQTMAIHPHGDSSIYQSIVGLSQPWKNNICLIQGHGNYGNVQGDGAAAARYIEAKMPEFSWDCFFEEMNKYPDIVDIDPKTKLPTYLPAKYPVIFLNGSLGIGSGYKTDIPPFNFKEICEATLKLLNNKKANIEVYPDMPVPCDILDKEKFKDIYAEGRGSFRMRGHVRVEDGGIRIMSVPYGVPADKVTTEIKELVLDKVITTIVDLKNFTTNNNVDIYLPLMRGADAHKTLELLYKHTSLQVSFSMSHAVLDGLLFLTGMKDVIRSTLLGWIDFREFTILRKISLELKSINTRLHVLDALIKMLSHPKADLLLGKVRHIKGGREAVINFYIKEFGITDLQAKSIASMYIYEISADYLPIYTAEHDKLKAQKNAIKDTMLKEGAKGIMARELQEGIAKYGKPRNCEVLSRKDELGLDDTQHSILITSGGYVKKLKDTYDTEFGIYDKVDGRVDTLTVAKVNANNLDELYIFTQLGKVYRFPIHTIPDCLKNNSGIKLNNYCKIADNDMVVAAYTSTELERNKVLYILSNTGSLKKTKIEEFVGSSATTVAKLKKDEVLVAVEAGHGDEKAFVYTSTEMRRMDAKDIPEFSRNAQGKPVLGNDETTARGIAIYRPFRGGSKKVNNEPFLLIVDDRNRFKVVRITAAEDKSPVTITSCDEDAIYKCVVVSSRDKYKFILSSGIEKFDGEWIGARKSKDNPYIEVSTLMSKPKIPLAKVKDILLGVEKV